MVKVSFVLILLTIFNRSNKFNQKEIIKCMKNIPTEYMITNRFAKFKYEFNKPKVITLKDGVYSREVLEQIKKSKFGVIIKYENILPSMTEKEVIEHFENGDINEEEEAEEEQQTYEESYDTEDNENYETDKENYDTEDDENYESEDEESYKFEVDDEEEEEESRGYYEVDDKYDFDWLSPLITPISNISFKS